MGASLCLDLNSATRFCSFGIRSRKTSFKSYLLKIKCTFIRNNIKHTVACVDE